MSDQNDPINENNQVDPENPYPENNTFGNNASGNNDPENTDSENDNPENNDSANNDPENEEPENSNSGAADQENAENSSDNDPAQGNENSAAGSESADVPNGGSDKEDEENPAAGRDMSDPENDADPDKTDENNNNENQDVLPGENDPDSETPDAEESMNDNASGTDTEDGTGKKNGDTSENDSKDDADAENDGTEENRESEDNTDEQDKQDDPEQNYPAFSDFRVVNGVCVTVSADEGTFPGDAVLSVTPVYGYTQTAVESAVEECRDFEQNVAASYTFDISVFNAENEELQPANGANVSISFTMAEVADRNLDTRIYHVENEEGMLLATELDTAEAGTTASAVTDGFSYYTVEFTYETKQYVLSGDESVPLSEILATLSLTGTVTEAKSSNAELFSFCKRQN